MDNVTNVTEKRWKEKQKEDRAFQDKISKMVNGKKNKTERHGSGNSATKRHKRRKK